MSCEVPCSSVTATSGQRSDIVARSLPMAACVELLPAPIRRLPESCPLMRVASSSSSRCAPRICSALASRRLPSAVELMPRGVRSNSVSASASSIALMWALTAGWLRCRSSDARVMLPSRATTMKVLS